jgi:hypothetical protein
MAEQFVLKGVNSLVDYSSSGAFTFSIKNDPRGGDTWQIPQWWDKKANNTVYNSCTVIDLIGTNYVMIIPSSVDTQLMVTYDNDVYNIGFSNYSAVDRVAITSKDQKKIVIEYLFPSISGGAIAKRLLQAASTIGTFDISGSGAVDVGNSSSYQSNSTPSVNDAVYAWTVEQGGSAVATSKAEVTSGATAANCTVNWKQAGSYDVKCTITSNTASDSPQSDTQAVTCSVVNTVGTATVSGSATPVALHPDTYSVSVAGNNVSDLTYNWSVVDATAQIANKNAASTGITFETAGNATVQCVVSSDSAPSVSDTLSVVASKQTIGAVTVGGPATVAYADLNTGKNYTSSNGSKILAGNTTYQWTVDNGKSGTTGATINSPNAQNTQVVFTAAGLYTLTCTWTNQDASPTSKVGSKETTVLAS